MYPLIEQFGQKMLTDLELNELDALLLSIPEEAGGLLLSEFDGFCAALVVCPEMILPGEWLPCVWGQGGVASFETMDEVQKASNLIMRHYNDVAQSLMPSEEYGPIYDEDRSSGDVMWELWVTGFERAMRLRPDAWESIVLSGDEEAAACVNMMLALFNIAEGQSELPKESIQELSDRAADFIPYLVVTINHWTKFGATPAPFPSWAAANKPTAPFRNTKTGRNDLCPCGSGRKYKRCCGAT